MNSILCSYKHFVWVYIDDIVIFSKTLEDHTEHLNIIFFLFDSMRISMKETKIYLEYSSIILLDQQVNSFDMIISEERIAAIWDLSFPETLKNLEKYLGLTDWLWQYVSYYTQVSELLQDRKTALLCDDSMSDQTRKNYSKKISIINASDEWWWWSVRSYSQRKLSEDSVYSLSQQTTNWCWDTILIYWTGNCMFGLNS